MPVRRTLGQGGQTNRQTVRRAENIGQNEDSNRQVNRQERVK